MKYTIKLPRLGETVDEVAIDEWVAAVGMRVEAGEILLRVETDKATVEVPSPVAGLLKQQLVAAGDDVQTGQAIAIIEG